MRICCRASSRPTGRSSGLADSVNGIQATYPDPAQGWNTATAPPLYRTDLEVSDGNRRLMAAPAFDFVPYPEQVQRLQLSGIQEAQRARTHVLPMPPAYWVVEPGDVGTWSSLRNGYDDKLFRVDSVVDQANLDVAINVTEVDPADYSWDHTTDYTGVSTGPTVFPRPPPQGVVDWFAEGTILYDADGLGRRVAIRIAWDGTLPGLVGVQYEVRLTADLSSVTRGRTDQLAVGALIISQGLIPLTAYQVRGQYLPSSPRDMLWSDWLDVTTPEEPVADIPGWIAVQVTDVMDYLNDRLTEVEQRMATITATNGQRNWLDQKELRSQLSSTSGAASAAIDDLESVMTTNDTALASSITSLTATVGDNTANITTNATAIATLDGYAATQYSVTLDVNNYATGFNLINAGGGVSSTTFTTAKFQIAAPGVGGGAAVPIFTVASVGGVNKVALRGDMYVDGTIAGSAMVTGSLTATQIAAHTITATQIAANTITANEIATGTITSASGVIGALSVQSLSIAGQAVIVPAVQVLTAPATGSGVSSLTISINTVGLAGQAVTIFVQWLATAGASGATSGYATSAALFANGVQIGQGGVSIDNFTTINTSLTVFGVYSYTASGGVDNIPIRVDVGGGVNVSYRALFAQAAKR